MMTSLTSTIRRYADKLAKIIGHIILRLIMVAVVVAVVVGLADALRQGDHTSTPAPTPAAATPATGPLGVYDVPTGTLTVERDGSARYQPAPSSETASGLVAVDSHQVSGATWSALLAAGATGHAGDGTDDVVYATPQMLMDALEDLGSR